MPWTSGITRVRNELITVAEYNNRNGAGGNFDLLSDGTRIVMPVYESSMEIGNAPTNKKILTAQSAQTGGFLWDGDVDEAITLSFLNM